MTDLVHRLVRRRLALGLVIVLAVVVAGAGWASAGSSRLSGAAVVIVPPPLGEGVADQNPLLNLDNNLSQLATVLAAALQSSTVADELKAVGATASFTISTITGDNPSFAQLSPQMAFTVTGSNAAVAKRTSAALVAQAQKQLSALQDRANVPSTARATIVVVVPPTDGEAVGGGRLRSAGSLGLAVVILGALGVLLLDEIGRRQSSRPAVNAQEEPATHPVAGEVDAGEVDAGEVDAGDVDAGDVDAGDVDAGEVDAGEVDAGEVDAGDVDAGDVGTSVPAAR